MSLALMLNMCSILCFMCYDSWYMTCILSFWDVALVCAKNAVCEDGLLCVYLFVVECQKKQTQCL